MEKLSWIHLLILSLATFRLTHLVVFDKITAFLRKPFIEVYMEVNGDGEHEQVVNIKGAGLRYWIGSLLSCHWCTGIWCSTLVILTYLYIPAVFPVLVILAVAGAAALIESHIL